MRWATPSGGRMTAGILLFLLGGTLALLGVQALPDTVDAHGHDSAEVRLVLVGLGVAGGLFSIGLVLVIWDIGMRVGRP